jgi:WD40 repeat protein
MATEVKLVNAIDAHWNALIRKIPVHRSLTAIIFSLNGPALAVVTGEYVQTFETATGVATFEVNQSAVSVALSPDDYMLAYWIEDRSVRVWDVQTSNPIQKFVGHEGAILSVAFSPCGNMIVSGSDDKMVRIWDISSGCGKCLLEGHSDSVSAVCWSGTGDSVISGSEDASVRVWDVSRETCLMILRAHCWNYKLKCR